MRKLKKVLAISFTVVMVLLFILTSLTPYISPLQFPYATLLSIAYGPILLVYCAIIIAWWFFHKRTSVLLLLVLITGYKSITTTVAFHPFAKAPTLKRDTTSLRVLSWNVNTFGDPFVVNDSAYSRRRQMLAFIAQYQPDILCLQDLGEKRQTHDKRFVENIKDIMATGAFAGYNYPFFFEFEGYKHAKLGVAIFTRLPVIDTGSVNNGGNNRYERTAYMDVLYKNKPVRVFSAHLSSMSLWPSDKSEAGINYLEGDSTRQKARSIFSKIRRFGEIHVTEATLLKSFINKSPYPVIFCADLNSVPSGYVYHLLKENLDDAFLEKGFGTGGTYDRIFPRLRIDVMLHSPQLQVKAFTRQEPDLSDHYPLIADFHWKQ